jgi:hypothetical protein
MRVSEVEVTKIRIPQASAALPTPDHRRERSPSTLSSRASEACRARSRDPVFLRPSCNTRRHPQQEPPSWLTSLRCVVCRCCNALGGSRLVRALTTCHPQNLPLLDLVIPRSERRGICFCRPPRIIQSGLRDGATRNRGGSGRLGRHRNLKRSQGSQAGLS